MANNKSGKTLEQRESEIKKRMAQRTAGLQKQLDNIAVRRQIAALKAKLKK